MIIDKILDRKDGKKYIAKEFYNDVMNYGAIGYKIADQLDSGTNESIQKALCNYIIDNDYNPDICNFINNNKWI